MFASILNICFMQMNNYIRLPKPKPIELIGLVIWILFLLGLFYLGTKKKDKVIVFAEKLSKKMKRRGHLRVSLEMEAKLVNLEDQLSYPIKILDLSTGGLKVEGLSYPLLQVEKFKILSPESPWNRLNFPRIYVKRARYNQRKKTVILNCKFHKLTDEQRRILAEEVQTRIKEFYNR